MQHTLCRDWIEKKKKTINIREHTNYTCTCDHWGRGVRVSKLAWTGALNNGGGWRGGEMPCSKAPWKRTLPATSPLCKFRPQLGLKPETLPAQSSADWARLLLRACICLCNYMLATLYALTTTPPQIQYLHKQHCHNYKCACDSHPTVLAFIEYLRRERIPHGWPGLLRNVLSHPLPVSLVSCNVTLLEFDLIGRQEAHHILLLLFDLCAVEMNEDRGEAVSCTRSVQHGSNFSFTFDHSGVKTFSETTPQRQAACFWDTLGVVKPEQGQIRVPSHLQVP